MVTAVASPDSLQAYTYTYDELDLLVLADRLAGINFDRTFAYDDADNMTFNSGLCTWPGAGYPHTPRFNCVISV
jgi:hypothetical protein